MFMGILPACMCIHRVCDWCWQNQSRVLDPLELELRVVVSCRVGAKNRTWVLSVVVTTVLY